ncbi:uncharacterized protein BXZ73DRAFT_92088 [Epithele typhae]|uniref:uncharacterized protein n=1 Tax=Epithele typhae TaxID=378194 RepID=UPI00200825C2|nr:uncharacterized protein BXZ73DRAFT_92088 [Epithele typhae]KAH9919496.1 hypothetical protein BXZ73DRAFT_92088 [Epithele typhae]
MAETVAEIDTGGKGLFSLVEAAAISHPVPTIGETSADMSLAPGSFNGPSSLGGASNSVGSTSKAHAAMKHRRLSSTGQARRRMSDAREANSRPSPAMLHNAAATLSSLAALSLSGSPPPPGVPQAATSFTSASGTMAFEPVPKVEARDDEITLEDTFAASAAKAEIQAAGISVSKSGKKRGTIFKCESCSKVYRHPSCLIKHRWEHSPHWREASKFLLSKHQQVQLLEAAAILSHLAPSASGGTSLPEDRSLWPSFLSGGLLPPPDQANLIHEPRPSKPRSVSISGSLEHSFTHPVSSSVPAPSLLSASLSTSSAPGFGTVSSRSGSRSGTATSLGRSPSAGPRLHNYALPSSGGGLTHVRPGVVGVPTDPTATPEPDPARIRQGFPGPPRSAPMPVPGGARHAPQQPDGAYSFVSGASVSDAWGSPVSTSGFAQSSFRSSVGSTSGYSASAMGRSFSDGWSLPRSSVRSGSGSGGGSRSRSGSADQEVEMGDADFVDGDEGVRAGRFGFTSRGWKQAADEKIEEEWDGMEMEMEM